MAEILGRGTIEIVADARKLRAGIEEARRSIRTLGEGQKDISKAASASIDKYIGKLQQQAATLGKTTRETELYKLALRGASNEQIKAADSALRVVESQEKMARLSSQLRAGALAAAAAAAAMATAFASAVQGSIDLADHLNDLSKSTGISVENLTGLNLLAKQTGTDLDGLAKGINKMSVEMGKSPKEFRALGVTAKDSIGAFKQLADVFLQIEDVQLRNALANKVFGKSWEDLAGALSEGSAGIAATIEKGQRLSGITQENAERAAEFKSKLAELTIASQAFGLELLPTLIKIVAEMNNAVTATGNFARGLSALASLKMGNWGADAAEQLRQIDEALERDEKIRAGTRGARVTAAVLDVRKEQLLAMRQIVTAQLAAQAAPELGSHLTPAQDAAAEAARIAAAKRAAAAARGFVAEGGGTDTRAQEAKARLALDLENIRKAGEAQIAAFSNAEKIMEALRAAALVNDKDYYASKQAFIRLNAQASETALTEEIARLQRETFAGKTAAQDRLANQKAIAEAQAKLSKVRADSAANATVTSIQEAAAVERLTKAYNDAKIEADEYIDTIARRNERELAGIGQGTKAREIQAGLSEIEDKRIAARQRIARDRRNNPEIDPRVYDRLLAKAEETYRREVDLYNERTAAITAAEQNWVNGAMQALSNYADEAKNIAKQTEELFTKSFQSLEDALVEFTQTGKLNFKSLADSIAADITRMSVKQAITGPLAEWMKGAVGEGGALTGILGALIPGGMKGGAGAAAGAALTAEVAAAGAALTAEVTAAGLAFTTETTLGGATFATEVTAAGAAFAASVAAASAASGASSIGGAVAGSFAQGTSYVPQTGLYQLHQGERVIPASENSGGRSVVINMPVSFHGPQDQRSVSQGLVRASRMLEREIARGTAG